MLIPENSSTAHEQLPWVCAPKEIVRAPVPGEPFKLRNKVIRRNPSGDVTVATCVHVTLAPVTVGVATVPEPMVFDTERMSSLFVPGEIDAVV